MKPFQSSIFVIAVFFVAANMGCTRSPGEKSRLSIQLPKGGSVSLSSKSVSALEGPTWSSAVPSSLSDIGCYGVFVGGPEPEMSSSYCKNSEGTTVATFGIQKGFISAGGRIELEVTPGNRKIYLFGSKLVSGSCVDLFTGSEPPFANYSNPYLLGVVEASLKPGLQEVTINAVGDFGASKKIDDCSFAGKRPTVDLVYGSGLDGDVIIDNNFNYYTSTATYTDGNGRTRVFNASRRLKSIDIADPHKIEFYSSYSSSGIIDYSVGDEIMWWVVGANGATPDSACVTNGSSNAARGKYGFARVVSTPDSTHLRLDRVIIDQVNNSNLLGSPASGSFCAIQIVRVPNFDHLTVANTAGVSFKSGQFSSSLSVGGIIAMRVKSAMNFAANFSVMFDANASGYEPGTVGGDSGNSSLGVNKFPGAAGRGDVGNGGGGGANGGAGGDGYFNPGSAGMANLTCGGNVCDPNERLFMGAGGGASGGTVGGAGGGVIFVMAKTVTKVAAGPYPYIQANGSASGNYGGGGAGGTIFWKSESLSVPFSLLSATGGGGGPGGGGGGGGLIKMAYCSNTETLPSANVSGGTGANAAANGVGAAVSGVCTP